MNGTQTLAICTITVTGPTTPGMLDDGVLVWLGARGGVTRVPVALTR